MALNSFTMVETGGIFIVLPLVVMLLSLLPVCILFVRKVAINTLLNVLSVLCLSVFLHYLSFYFIQPRNVALQTGFALAAFTLSFYLFRLMMRSSAAKDIMNMLLVSFLSVVITIYALKGIPAYTSTLTIVQAALLTVLALAVLFQLISDRQIALVDEPAFWIAGGLLSYYGMVLFMEAIAGNRSTGSQQVQLEKDLIITVADILRMVFFIVAACMASRNNGRPNHIEEPPPPPPPTRRPIKIKY
ncbi:hypothetical protein [Longitalea arenae]|uniref:hypothetical protein n=1 Tax=Longitalea arenae TaxID=2812558 RepID=UPI001968357B|nr:hypothetical protein [Longitalea arenae]